MVEMLNIENFDVLRDCQDLHGKEHFLGYASIKKCNFTKSAKKAEQRE